MAEMKFKLWDEEKKKWVPPYCDNKTWMLTPDGDVRFIEWVDGKAHSILDPVMFHKRYKVVIELK